MARSVRRAMWVLLGWTCLAEMPAFAAGYYVSPSGSDTNPGTRTNPWQTIGRVNSATFHAGDHLFFQGGQSFSGNLLFGPNDSGTPGRPIVISSYGGGRATILAGSGAGITISNTAGIAIDNLIVVGGWNAATQNGNNASGIAAYNTLDGAVKLSYLRIDHCAVSGFQYRGIEIGAYPADGSKSGFNDVRITNCAAHDNGNCGIMSWGNFDPNATQYAHANVYVGHCQAYNNLGFANANYNTGSGIEISDVCGGLIERCIASNNGGIGWGGVGIWFWDSTAGVIQFCESYANRTSNGTDGDGFDLDGGCTHCLMQYNYSHGNAGSGFPLFQFGGARPFYDNTIRYNISENDGRTNGAGIALWTGGSGLDNSDIYNNTVYITPGASTPAAIWFLTGTGNLHIRNNLLVATGGVPLLSAPSGQSGALLQGNDYGTDGSPFRIDWQGATYASLSAFQSGAGQEMMNGAPTGFSADPGLTNPGNGGTIGNADLLGNLSAYQLQPGSPLIQAGIDLPSQFGLSAGVQDFYGNRLLLPGDAYGVGAHQYSAAPFFISGLFNSGLDAGGDLAPDAGIDAHYLLTSTPSGAANAAVPITDEDSSLFPTSWLPDTRASKWISPTAEENPGDRPGSYAYQTTFSLTGEVTSASLSGRLAADSQVASVSLNGHGFSVPANSASAWTSFTVTSGFRKGLNTLKFVVKNTGTAPNPSGFRVEFLPSGIQPFPSGVPLFVDDFEYWTMWDSPGGPDNNFTVVDGSWSVAQSSGNSQEYGETASGGGIALLALRGSSDWTDYSVRAYVNVPTTSPNTEIGLLARVQDASHFYALALQNGATWTLYKNESGVTIPLAGGTYPYAANTYYILKLDLNGSTLTASISSDDGSTFQTLGSSTDATWPAGTIGLLTGNTGGRFDEVHVDSN